MELRDYIEAGIHKAGTGRALAAQLGLGGSNEITDAKAQRRGLPMHAVVKLADYIGADLRELIAANELATEKKEERREFWSRLLKQSDQSYIRHMMI